MDAVTGAFGYTGRCITRRLLDAGREVRTLTGHPGRPDPFGGKVGVVPFAFNDPAALAAGLAGTEVLYNTYWVRFPYRGVTFDQALANTRALLQGARDAGVRRVVHISITNPARESALPYFRGKALAEEAVAQSGLSHAFVRPTVVFGPGDILVNNIAWLVRRLPLFGIPGTGTYRVRPVFVGDVADLAVEAGGRDDDFVMDAVGPETYTFDELVRLVARSVGRRPLLVHLPPRLISAVARILGLAVGDVLLTADEVRGLMEGLVTTDGPATGSTKLSEWLDDHADDVGRVYASELARHYR
jgi:NADH dehydrogenase